ncbi:MAG TPA: cell division protein ZapA [Acetobacteraceae bacterium]|nr:cell division protein ZapA [Acetobacteraceae bacterium]
MAQVTLRINGYAYTLGCQDGEEAHLHAMAAEVDQRIEGVKASAGPSGEARMLVIAALLMADDIYELRQKLAPAGPGGEGSAPDSASGSAPAAESRLGRRLGKLAKRAEDIAAGLEHP